MSQLLFGDDASDTENIAPETTPKKPSPEKSKVSPADLEPRQSKRQRQLSSSSSSDSMDEEARTPRKEDNRHADLKKK